MKRLFLVSLYAVLLLCVHSCAEKKPGIEELRPLLEAALNYMERNDVKSLNELLGVSECRKTNGMSPTDREYVLEFEGTLEVKESFYKVQSIYGHYLTPPRNPCDKPVVKIQAGQLIPFKGSAIYELTENRWRCKELKSDIVCQGMIIGAFKLQ